MRTLVSVIVPVFNSERYLKECIESIQNQTYENIEIVFVDDGSTDGSLKICRDISTRNSNIKLLHKENSGVSAARNSGICMADGKYICFIDSDDLIVPDFIDTLVSNIENTDFDIVFSGHMHLYKHGLVNRRGKLREGIYEKDQLLTDVIDDGTLSGILFGSVCGAIYRREYLVKHNLMFDEDISVNEDGLFNIGCIEQTSKIRVLAYNGYIYRQWKTEKINLKEIRPDNKFELTTSRICEKYSEFPEFEKQIQRRIAYGYFRYSIKVRYMKGSLLYKRNVLCGYIKTCDIDKAYRVLNFNKLSSEKKILYYLLKRRYLWTFCFLLTYAYPVLKLIRK